MKRMRLLSSFSSSAGPISKRARIRRLVEEGRHLAKQTIQEKQSLRKAQHLPREKRRPIWVHCGLSRKAMLLGSAERKGSVVRVKVNVAPVKRSTKLHPRIKWMTRQLQPDFLAVDGRNRMTEAS